jgi:hypothetical protein
VGDRNGRQHGQSEQGRSMFHEKSTGFVLRLFDGAGLRPWPSRDRPERAFTVALFRQQIKP